ncbi:MAG: hypothetical protein JNM94_14185 [Phycisphaerae bacterium]|nr:hypothetical protein [Phycisphaerae bacterium]
MPARRLSLALALALFAVSDAARGDVVIGGFNAARGGQFSIAEGSAVSQLRAAMLAAAPDATFTGSATLTPRYLATVDILFLSSATAGSAAITPLSSDEQNALSQFVMNGGRAILATDNETFAGANSDPANESLINFLQLDSGGTGAGWPQTAEIPQPFLWPIATGPYGQVSSYGIGWTGWYEGVIPATATTVGVVAQNGAFGFLIFPPDVLGPTSGAVVTYSDSTMFADGYFETNANNVTLLKNTIAYLVGAGSCAPDLTNDGAVDGADLGVMLGAWNTADSAADLDDDGVVAGSDLGILLGAWGPC